MKELFDDILADKTMMIGFGVMFLCVVIMVVCLIIQVVHCISYPSECSYRTKCECVCVEK